MSSAVTTFAVGDLCRLAEGVGTKAQSKLVFRIDGTHARSGDFLVSPVTGGKGARVPAYLLTAATEADKARAAALPAPAEVVLGSVVSVAPNTLRGATPEQRYVVLNVNTDSTVRLALLGGDGGRYYPKCPLTALRVVDVTA